MTTPSSECYLPKDVELAVASEVIDIKFVSRDDRPISCSCERLLTPEDVALVLQIGRTRAYELLTHGDLRSVKIGKSRRIRRTDLDDFILNLTSESNGR